MLGMSSGKPHTPSKFSRSIPSHGVKILPLHLLRQPPQPRHKTKPVINIFLDNHFFLVHPHPPLGEVQTVCFILIPHNIRSIIPPGKHNFEQPKFLWVRPKSITLILYKNIICQSIMWPTMELYSKNMKRYLKNSLTKIQTKESVLISHSLSIGFNC